MASDSSSTKLIFSGSGRFSGSVGFIFGIFSRILIALRIGYWIGILKFFAKKYLFFVNVSGFHNNPSKKKTNAASVKFCSDRRTGRARAMKYNNKLLVVAFATCFSRCPSRNEAQEGVRKLQLNDRMKKKSASPPQSN